MDSAAQLEEYRTALTGHCYRMLGSVTDAEDAVQDTMIRAWQGWESFGGRSSVKTWLYRIATNVCFDILAVRKRRMRPSDEGSAGSIHDPLEQKPFHYWIEPIADIQAIPSNEDPAQQAILQQSIRLAFVAALQHLPPKQRAALLLTEVLGWSVNEVADSLESSTTAVNSALQRARSSLAIRRQPEPAALKQEETDLLNRYVDAFQRYDIDSLTKLLHQDAVLSMPPYTLWFHGPKTIQGWLLGRGSVCRNSKLFPTAACGLPAFAHYHADPEKGYTAWALIVLEVSDGCIRNWTSFMDTEKLFPRFGFPLVLPQYKDHF